MKNFARILSAVAAVALLTSSMTITSVVAMDVAGGGHAQSKKQGRRQRTEAGRLLDKIERSITKKPVCKWDDTKKAFVPTEDFKDKMKGEFLKLHNLDRAESHNQRAKDLAAILGLELDVRMFDSTFNPFAHNYGTEEKPNVLQPEVMQNILQHATPHPDQHPLSTFNKAALVSKQMHEAAQPVLDEGYWGEGKEDFAVLKSLLEEYKNELNAEEKKEFDKRTQSVDLLLVLESLEYLAERKNLFIQTYSHPSNDFIAAFFPALAQAFESPHANIPDTREHRVIEFMLYLIGELVSAVSSQQEANNRTPS